MGRLKTGWVALLCVTSYKVTKEWKMRRPGQSLIADIFSGVVVGGISFR